MPFVKWTDKASVGIKEIDAQHQKFFGYVNNYYDLCQSEKYNPKKAKDMMSEILSYARKHFSTEERYFEKYNYPQMNEHKEEHLKLINRALKIYDSFDGEKETSLVFLEFLKDWLEKHLKEEDGKYAEYFSRLKIKF
jgi:hemerythrin